MVSAAAWPALVSWAELREQSSRDTNTSESEVTMHQKQVERDLKSRATVLLQSQRPGELQLREHLTAKVTAGRDWLSGAAEVSPEILQSDETAINPVI